MGGGISKSATWILPCTRTIEVQVCSESGCARRIFLGFRVNPLVESGLTRTYYGKDRERDRHSGAVRDPRSSGRDPTPDRRSHSREKVDDHTKRAGDSRDKKDGQDTREKRRDFSPHLARDRSSNCECTQVDDDYTNICAFFNAAPAAANEADRADDRLLSASIPHPSRNPRIPSLHVAPATLCTLLVVGPILLIR